VREEVSAVLVIRLATPDDTLVLGGLLEAFVHDAFGKAWGGSRQKLAQGLAAGLCEVSLAVRPGAGSVGFAAWERSYDLHHCVAGGHLIDMFVRPAHRGWGVALALVADVAARVRDRGGCYLRGQAVPIPAVEHLYDRVGVLFPGAECNVGGRAFRAVADLAGVPAREAARRLPPKEWNYDP
jgi:GNAT superfamily N-acetyltransferase